MGALRQSNPKGCRCSMRACELVMERKGEECVIWAKVKIRQKRDKRKDRLLQKK